MKKVFLDFGGNRGQGLREFIKRYNINIEEWIVETFEPDPECKLEENISDLNFVKINKKAVWVYNGKVKFSQMLECSEGSSVECLMSEGICREPNNFSFRKHDSIIDVECIDISDILRKYQDFEFVLVKMDVEGSEFKLLRKILQDGTINIIDVIYIEWHHEYVKDESFETSSYLKTEIKNIGIEVHDWH